MTPAEVERTLAFIQSALAVLGGKDVVLAARKDARGNRRVVVLEVKGRLLGGEFKTTWTFDGRKD